MKTLTSFLACALTLALTIGCGEKDHDHDHDKAKSKSAEGSGMKKEDDHGEDHGHGAETSWGRFTIEGSEMEVVGFGEFKVGEEYHLDVRHHAGELPEVLRLWVGDAQATGTAKSKAEKMRDHFHGHVDVPGEIKADHRLWIDAEFRRGRRGTAELKLP